MGVAAMLSGNLRRLDLYRDYRTLDLAPQIRTPPVNVVDLNTIGLQNIGSEKLPGSADV
jgi:hypothetical protein